MVTNLVMFCFLLFVNFCIVVLFVFCSVHETKLMSKPQVVDMEHEKINFITASFKNIMIKFFLHKKSFFML